MHKMSHDFIDLDGNAILGEISWVLRSSTQTEFCIAYIFHQSHKLTTQRVGKAKLFSVITILVEQIMIYVVTRVTDQLSG